MGKTVLIAGASGLVGTACVQAYIDAEWDVVAVSRRHPEADGTPAFTHLPINLQDAADCSKAAEELRGITHVVYAALYEHPGLRAGWQDPDQMQTNLRMLRNLIETLISAGAPVEHVTLLQGTKAYGGHLHRMRIPARERFPRDNHDNFYWLQEDYLTQIAREYGFAWTILRPTVVLGAGYGAAMSLIPVIGIFGAICREEGRPFGYPGHVEFVHQAVDCRIVAHAAIWAGQTELAHYEHFNLSNGEVFSWRDLWPAIAQTLGLDAGPDRPVSLVELSPAGLACGIES